MNPFDLITVPPAMVKQGFEDLHEIAQIVRRYLTVEDDILARIERLEQELTRTRAGVERLQDEIVGVRRAAEALPPELDDLEQGLGAVRTAVEPLSGKLDSLAELLSPIQHLDAIRRGIEPLAASMAVVRESVDDLEPMLGDVHKTMSGIDTQIDEMQESVQPIGELADRIPGIGKRRR